MLEQRIAQAFVELADTLVAGFDAIDLLHTLTERCADLLEIEAAGILLADQRGGLHAMAATDQRVQLLELLQRQEHDGPCLDVYRTGRPVACTDLATDRRWPAFAAAARACGFSAVYGLPLRLRDQTIGAMNLLSTTPGGLSAEAVAIAQALADVATISVLTERVLQQQTTITEQLQGALNSRVLIEQAKGVLAAHHRLTVADAFVLLRAFARSRNRNLTEVATAVIDRAPDIAELLSPGASPGQTTQR
ncbi:GAF and ANTAR domain-containing protein [Actinomadura hibisca]|uniref:GAF and ANTAR domain-containing protein n=1 Tax=Actinomadura hibisca TaxID=68565 RepID=UPI0008320B10|nr:GAF and ANTAR domain-containing protein [Actinomadura hibisca]